MSLEERHQSITIRGLVCPSDWDEDDQPSRVSVFTFDDDEYEVEPRDAGHDLLLHLGQEVMARGHVLPAFKRRKVVLIMSFTVVGPNTTETIEAESAPLGPAGLDL